MKPALAAVALALLVSACCPNLGAQGTAETPSAPASNALSRSQAKGPTFKVQVNLVQVEASVRDEQGRVVDNLTRQDFRLYEDGVEQQIRYFSHDELPLAIALVLDSSTSVAAALQDLREGALDTLSLLKADDEVAVFSFTEKPQLVQGLTTDRSALLEDIAAIAPGGGTNINDALYAASHYLGQQVHGPRHAVILVSDNVASDRGTYDEQHVVRAALDSGTLIYSIKVGFWDHSRLYYLMHPDPYLGWVNRICHETGGEVIDSQTVGSVTAALATIISQLKEGYTLGYISTNQRQDGSFRKIAVRLAAAPRNPRRKYTISARRGYYAPAGLGTYNPTP